MRLAVLISSIAVVLACGDARRAELQNAGASTIPAAGASAISVAGASAIPDAGASRIQDAKAAPEPSCPSGSEPLAPLPERPCPSAREAIGGKFSASEQRVWAQTAEPQRVLIAVRDGAMLCPLPECPANQRECPERSRVLQRWSEENAAAQRCVKSFVSEVGGVVSGESFGSINVFEAVLTWPQIQKLATHPHVLSISASQTNTPPP